MKRFFRRLKSYLPSLLPKSLQVTHKHAHEVAFWKEKYAESLGAFDNSHYKYFYTAHFGIDPEEYVGRNILDIGCGPRGSLEWAEKARERVGLDPLVDQYRELGINKHYMSYVCAPSEMIPFPDGYFDFVASFNSLDHVDNVEKTLSEIARVTRKDGTLLVITEINHPPTSTEPHTLTESLIERLSIDFTPITVKLVAIRDDHDIYGSLYDGIPYQPVSRTIPAILSARLIKKS